MHACLFYGVIKIHLPNFSNSLELLSFRVFSHSQSYADVLFHYSGNILAWDLSKSSKQKWRLFDEGRHSRIVFSVCHHAANDVMISVSMDRQVSDTHA